jgi:hypothetical protein
MIKKNHITILKSFLNLSCIIPKQAYNKKMTVEKLNLDEVRRGWVRINIDIKDFKANIPSNSLIKITNHDLKPTKSVLTLMYGKRESGNNREEKPKHNGIAMDEPTRTDLGVKNGDKVNLRIKKLCSFRKINFYWNHYNPDTKFNFRISLILGSISLFVGIISLVISLIGVIFNI